MEKTRGAGRNPPCPADGVANPLRGGQARGSPGWVGGSADPPPLPNCAASHHSPAKHAGVCGAAERDKRAGPPRRLLLLRSWKTRCPSPTMGAASGFRQRMVLGQPPPGFAHDAASQRVLSPAAWPGDWGQLGETGRRWESRGGLQAPR